MISILDRRLLYMHLSPKSLHAVRQDIRSVFCTGPGNCWDRHLVGHHASHCTSNTTLMTSIGNMKSTNLSDSLACRLNGGQSN